MPRIDVPFKVDKQMIIQTPPVKIAAGGKNYFYAVFDLCETWKDVPAEKAVFIRDDIRKAMSLTPGENDCLECEIPWEVMQEPGLFYVGIFGGDTLLTNTHHVKVIEGCIREGDEPLPPTPDWFNKVENDVAEAKAVATKVAEDAAAGKFDGEPGPQGPKGERGPQGEPGATGPKGDPYTLTDADKKEIIDDMSDAGYVKDTDLATQEEAGIVRFATWDEIVSEIPDVAVSPMALKAAIFERCAKTLEDAPEGSTAINPTSVNYVQQYVNSKVATREKAGMVRFATDEDFENFDSSVAITPFDLDYHIKTSYSLEDITDKENVFPVLPASALAVWGYVDAQIGSIETAVDAILAIQETLVGGVN